MNNLTNSGQPSVVSSTPGKASLVEIRTNNKKFPRLHTYLRDDAINNMNMIIMMAFQFRGQQTDVQTVLQISTSLIDILNEDEYGIGTKYISFEEIKRVVKKAVLGQGKEMFGISVSSIYQAIADYCKGEGRVADKQAKEIASRQREIRNSIIAPMLQGYSKEIIQRSKEMYETEIQRNYPQSPVGNQESVK